MSRPRARLLVATAALGWAWFAPVQAQDLDRVHRQLKDLEADAQQLQRTPLGRSQLRSPTHVEERLTDGELFFRLRDYVRASVILTDIADNYPQHRAYPDALFLLAESLFKANDYLGARTRYRLIIDRADQAPYRPFVQRALGRLIEIAIHIRDFDGVDNYFARLSQLPPTEVEAATNYFRAKYLYSVAIGEAESAKGEVTGGQVNQEGLEQARLGFEAVGARSPYYAQARYFIGVIYLLRGQLAPAVDAFQRVAALPVDTQEQRRVVELSYLAMGRLNYELDQLDRAIEAYQRVPRNSPMFDTALYEIAWVYIRMGDSTRAERALEVLSVAVPDSRHIPDGQLLRGNLLLRDGHFRGATQVFNEVSGQFGPVREELDRVLTAHEDVPAYFRQLVRQNLEVFDVSAFLPAQALRWAAAEGEMQRAMNTLSDLTQARQLVGETERIVARLNGALSSPNPVNVFADLRHQRERTITLRNRIARARRDLSSIEANANKQYSSAELDEVRKRRRELERSLDGAPLKPEDVEKRSFGVSSEFTTLGKELSRLEVDLLGMEARITATERFIGATMQGREPAGDGCRARRAGHPEGRRGRLSQAHSRPRDPDRDRPACRSASVTKTPRAKRQCATSTPQLVERERQILHGLGAQTERRASKRLPRCRSDRGDHRCSTISASTRLSWNASAEMRIVTRRRGRQARRVTARSLTELEGEERGGGRRRSRSPTSARCASASTIWYCALTLASSTSSWAVREEHRMRAELLTRERARSLQALEDEYRDIMDQQPEGER